MKIRLSKTVEVLLVLTEKEAELLKGLVQNPPVRTGDVGAFCSDLFELLKKNEIN